MILWGIAIKCLNSILGMRLATGRPDRDEGYWRLLWLKEKRSEREYIWKKQVIKPPFSSSSRVLGKVTES